MPQAAAAPARTTTVYIVLRANGQDGWREDGPHQTARNADQAIRQAAQLRAENQVDPAGVYVAVPLTSFKPRTIRAETQTILKVG